MSNTVIAVIGVVITFIGVVIAGLVHRHSIQQARESWLRTYKELHEAFWSDPDFREIRSWLACDSAYSIIQPIMKKRQLIAEKPSASASISVEEYQVLEKLDRFLHFLLRIAVLNPEFENRRDLWDKLYFGYWLKKFNHQQQRPELKWYYEEFYKQQFEEAIKEPKSNS